MSNSNTFLGFRFRSDQRAVAITVGEVTATGTLISGIGRGCYIVELDGTGQTVFVDREMLSEAGNEKEGA